MFLFFTIDCSETNIGLLRKDESSWSTEDLKKKRIQHRPIRRWRCFYFYIDLHHRRTPISLFDIIYVVSKIALFADNSSKIQNREAYLFHFT